MASRLRSSAQRYYSTRFKQAVILSQPARGGALVLFSMMIDDGDVGYWLVVMMVISGSRQFADDSLPKNSNVILFVIAIYHSFILSLKISKFVRDCPISVDLILCTGDW